VGLGRNGKNLNDIERGYFYDRRHYTAINFFDRKGVPIQPFGSEVLNAAEVFFAPSGACIGTLEEAEKMVGQLSGGNYD
jgi:hypothetical protein